MITDAICAVPISWGSVAQLCLIDAVSEVEVGSSFCLVGSEGRMFSLSELWLISGAWSGCSSLTVGPSATDSIVGLS